MTASRMFAARPASVPAARQFVLAQLARVADGVRETAALLVSELATNAVVHGRTRFEVSVEITAKDLRVEVADTGAGEPVVGPLPGPSDQHGRGLWLTRAMAGEWGVSHAVGTPPGKTVWFSLPLGRALEPAPS